MTSPYLLNRPVALAEYRDIVIALIDDLVERSRALSDAREWAEGIEHDRLGYAIDHISDEMARLEDRLDMLDEELGYRRDDDPGAPMVL